MKHARSERGQALILIALAAVGLFGFGALAIDGSMVYSVKRHAQNSADAAALSAALEKTRHGDWHQAAMDSTLENNFNNDGTTNTVEVYQCDDPAATCTGLPAGADLTEYIQVKILATVDTRFTNVIGRDTTQTAVEAIARSAPSFYDEMMYGNAVVGLSRTDCSAVWSNGHATTNIVGGGVFSNSSCDPSFRQNGSGHFDVTGGSITSVGNATYASGHVSPAPVVNPGAQLAYPPAMTMPNPACTGNAVQNGNSMNPGTWIGAFPPAGVTHLSGGIYCIHGDFRLNGGDVLTGSEVLIVMESGDIVWNGNSAADLAGPTEGPFEGLLIYVRFDPADPFANQTTITINGTTDLELAGSILAPASDVNILGTGDADGLNTQIIAYTVQFGGNSGARINYDDTRNYQSLIPPQVELTK